MPITIPPAFEHLITHPDLPFAHRVRYPRRLTGYRPPCLVLLHETGGGEMDLAELGFDQDEQLLVVLVRAPLEMGAGQYGWFHATLADTGPEQINAAEAEASRLALVQLINQLPLAYGVDPRQVYLAGFGQGGSMSAGVALTRPDKVAGFGLFSGRILSEIAPLLADRDQLVHLRAFVTHGQEDLVMPVDYARDALHMLMTHLVQTGYREYHTGHVLTEPMKQAFSEWLQVQVRSHQPGAD